MILSMILSYKNKIKTMDENTNEILQKVINELLEANTKLNRDIEMISNQINALTNQQAKNNQAIEDNLEKMNKLKSLLEE